jgi:hypothetical protein
VQAAEGQPSPETTAEESNLIRPYNEENDPPRKADEIAFLCPEGHHLIGPNSLVGRPGACPACSVKFLVPNPDELLDEDEVESEEGISPLIFDFEEGVATAEDEFGQPVAEAVVPTLGPLFEALWRYKGDGVSIELHLGEGKVIIPHGFARESARLRYGLFTVREANGTHTLSAIAWDSIVRVAVRGLQELPADVHFDIPE